MGSGAGAGVWGVRGVGAGCGDGELFVFLLFVFLFFAFLLFAFLLFAFLRGEESPIEPGPLL